MPPSDILRARGLADDPAPPQPMPFRLDATGGIVSSEPEDQPIQYLGDLPNDYGARVEALRLATGCSRPFSLNDAMKSAHAFLAFLTDTEKSDPPKPDRTFTDE